MLRRLLFVIIAAGQALVSSFSQNFSDYFEDATLRVDYTLAGTDSTEGVYFNELLRSPHWYGKRHNLSTASAHGNAQVELTDVATGQVIYLSGFSTLFQEWQSYDEAKQMPRAFEGVTLVPMPRKPAKVTIRLFDSYLRLATESSKIVDPADILIRHVGEAGVTPYEVVKPADDPSDCINVAFIAEGYTQDEMPKFIESVREASEAIFSYTPFKESAGKFQVVAVKAASAQSDVTQPSRGKWVNTLLNSNFDTFYSERYLTTLNLKRLHDALAGVPYEHIFILVNTERYGGGGIFNFYTIASAYGPAKLQVIVHEFGHAFAGLADEYAYEGDTPPMYPPSVEPWEDNITTLVDYASKWKDLEGQDSPVGKVGVYEGAGYSVRGVYRPTPSCRMRDNNVTDFCPVCQRAIQRIIDNATGGK